MSKGETQRELAEYVEEVVGPEARALAAQGNDPARVMVDLAKAEDIDVIVVGSVGMSGRKEFLLENVPNRVSHNAHCTVVIVQTHLDGANR
jgi:nucleotide-binding universal stress UspA family protein